MKNQYIGDVGDYGKYGLLRFLAENGVTIGVNWYLTEDDPSSNDGNINQYLNDDAERAYDPVVFDRMRQIVFEQKEKKHVGMIEAAGILPRASFYSEVLSTDGVAWRERKRIREQWHGRAMDALAGAELVFADPDTGTAEKTTRKGSDQYADVHELADYYKKRSQDIVYYCHRARRTNEAWSRKKTELRELLPDAALFVLTFRRGMQRSYIFAVHPGRAEKYRALIDSFLTTPWGSGLGGKRPPFIEESV